MLEAAARKRIESNCPVELPVIPEALDEGEVAVAPSRDRGELRRLTDVNEALRRPVRCVELGRHRYEAGSDRDERANPRETALDAQHRSRDDCVKLRT